MKCMQMFGYICICAFFRRGFPSLHQLLHGIFDLKREMKVCPGVTLSQVYIDICGIALRILSGEYPSFGFCTHLS